MGVFDFLKNKQNRNKVTYSFVLNEKGAYDFLYPEYRNLIDCPEIKTCVDKIADLVSNMTIHLMQNTENGDIRIINELSRKIDIYPYKNMTKKSWLYNIVYSLLLYGNAIVYPIIDSKSHIEDLVPFDMKLITNGSYKWNKEDGSYYVEYQNIIYKSDELVHFVLNPSTNKPFLGTGYRLDLKNISETLNLATETRKSFMNGKYMPNVIVKVDSNDSELTSEKGREILENKYLTRNKTGKPWIVPADMLDIQSIKPLTLKDIALNEAVELDKRTVAGVFGVPTFLLGLDDFNKEEFNMFISTKIMSIAKIIEQTLTKSLLTKEEWYFKCNPRSLYAYDISEIAEIGMSMYTKGLMLGNEVRDWIGMEPIAELNKLVILENYIPAEDIGKQKKLNKGGVENE